MKKLVALLLCLLMVAQFVPASAATVKDEFTSLLLDAKDVEMKGKHFTLKITSDYHAQDSEGFLIGGKDSKAVVTITATSGCAIDEVRFTPVSVQGTLSTSSGTQSATLAQGVPFSITGINSSEFEIRRSDDESCVRTAKIIVIGDDPNAKAPATGDATPIALLGCALVVSAFALAEIRRRRVHA